MSEVSDYNKSLTVKFFEQVFNQQNYDIVADTLAPNYTYNGSPTSAADTVAWAKGLHQLYPDLHFVIEIILGEDQNVALRWRMTATDQKSGKKGYITGTNILVIVDGKALSNDQGGGTQFIPNAS
ncbi:MAG TPA: ester cyclase [Chthoniobacter sp.]|jgi:predicted ester cyclase